ncbi:MAG: hypothetical protein V4696_01645 [Pseudomonadota bacterium]
MAILLNFSFANQSRAAYFDVAAIEAIAAAMNAEADAGDEYRVEAVGNKGAFAVAYYSEGFRLGVVA